MLFERMQLLPKLNGDIVPPAERTLFMLDRQTGIITTLATGNGAAAGPTFANRASRTVTWGVAPHSTTCCILKSRRSAATTRSPAPPGSRLASCPRPQASCWTARMRPWTRYPLTNIYVSWISSDANTGAQLNAGTTMVGLRESGQLRADFVTAPRDQDALAELTTRELEVLSLIAEGRTDRGIAQALYVTPKTVEAHVRSIFRKLDLPADATMENRRVHAVLTFLRTRA